MGFSIYYRSTRPVKDDRAEAIRKAAGMLIKGRTWLSCEPVGFFGDQGDGHLFGGSKPNFHPHPDDVTSALRENLPDGSVRDLINVLCELSRRFAVDWELSHDDSGGPVGRIQRGRCDPDLFERINALAEATDMIQEMEIEPTGEGLAPFAPFTEAPLPDDDIDDEDPPILPFSRKPT